MCIVSSLSSEQLAVGKQQSPMGAALPATSIAHLSNDACATYSSSAVLALPTTTSSAGTSTVVLVLVVVVETAINFIIYIYIYIFYIYIYIYIYIKCWNEKSEIGEMRVDDVARLWGILTILVLAS
jgi:hypothetical protein